MNNGRDCPHGRQVGKCDTCDLITAELGLEKVTTERDALAAQVDALRRELQACQNVLHSLAHDGQVTPAYANDAKKVLAATPQQHLLELRADTAEKFYYMGWEHSLSTKSDGGDHYGCGKRLAKSFADSVRRGEVEL